MSDSVNTLIDKWMNDMSFRASIRKDPEATIKKLHIELTPEEWTAFRAIDWTQSDEALSARASKVG